MPKRRYTIGINALFLVPNNVGGTEYYLRSFLEQLDRAHSQFNFVVFCNKENADTFTFSHSNWKKVVCPVAAMNRQVRILYEQLILPFLVEREHCDLLHSFGYFGPLFTTMPHVVTVHDVNWKDHPEDTSRFNNLMLKILCEVGMAQAARIVTDSQFSADRIKHFFPELNSKVAVIQPGVDPAFQQTTHSKLSPQKFLLCVSSFYPHKRIPYLLELWKSLQPLLPGYNLILVGQNGLDMDTVTKKITRLSHVLWYRKVSFKQLLALYRTSAAVIHPSMYEGFGYPVYEAASLNKKILVGNRKVYDMRVQERLHELTFNLQMDCTLVMQVLSNTQNTVPFQLSYKNSRQRLEQLYQEVLE